MPIFRINNSLAYYAHVPKCGGSSIADYLSERFGPLGFYDTEFHTKPPSRRWTRSSPQHADAETLTGLIPLEYFAAVFAFVRHPVPRAVSCYHFQADVEKSIPEGQSFSEWLGQIAKPDPEAPFAFDNHTRPMSEIVPESATVLHLEHGADQLIPWLDALTQQTSGPRFIPKENTQGQYTESKSARVIPSESDIALIAQIYATDFKRFGYRPGDKAPLAPKPEFDAGFLAARDRDREAANRPVNKLKRKIRRKLQKISQKL